MKIVFLCGSLEPGQDGVGDYTRRLGAELVKQGHEIAAVALKDCAVAEVMSYKQHLDCVNLTVLRLPSVMSEKERFAEAKKWIKKFNPNWISLQYVPFSFHPKGLSFSFCYMVKKLGENKQWHIMFHELWVGMNKDCTVKHKLLGWIQKQLIKSLILQLRPVSIHTHTQLYKTHLLNLGFNISYLPLFSNIPLICLDQKFSLVKNYSIRTDSIYLVVFGSIHPKTPVKEFARELSQFAQKYRRDISLTVIGRCGVEQSAWVSIFESEGIGVQNLGEQSPEVISHILQNSNWGISTTPLLLAEKSGTIAAMQQHGLPVICVTYSWEISKPKGAIKPLTGVYEYQAGSLELILTSNETCHGRSIQPSSIAKHLINTLDSISNQIE